MASNALGNLLGQIGAPFLRKAVEGMLPPPFNTLGGYAVDLIAERLGTAPTPEAIIAHAEVHPDDTAKVVRAIEYSPELVLAGVAQQHETNRLLLAEQAEPWWAWAWRPAGMWGLGILWFWSIIVLHVFNAWLKIALPQPDLWVLFQLSGLYMGLYMGGHTVKDFVAKKWGGA